MDLSQLNYASSDCCLNVVSDNSCFSVNALSTDVSGHASSLICTTDDAKLWHIRLGCGLDWSRCQELRV